MKKSSHYRWFLLLLAALTMAVVIGIPSMSLSVLFKEISSELRLNLVQMGLIWSIGSLPAIITATFGGALIDRFGPKRVILAGIILVSLSAGSRGLAADFVSFLIIILAVGGLVPLVSTSAFKLSGIWFPSRQLGLANGIISMGMAFGLMLGSLLSATVFSPLLGGWRNVMFFYAGLSALMCIPWLFTKPLPEGVPEKIVEVPMRQALTRIFRLKDIWLLGIAFLGIGGCQQGISGYLALYLRGIGWPDAGADGAVSLIFAMSLLFILPIAFASDRMRSRKTVLWIALAVMTFGSGLLSVSEGWLIWAAVALSGMMRDGSAALVVTMAVETEGVGPAYAGTASGLAMTFFFLGNLISPPIGNKLAEIAPGLPFAFWGGMAGLGIVSLLFIRSPLRSTPQPELPAAS